MPLTDLRASRPPAVAYDLGYARGLELEQQAEESAFAKLKYQDLLARLGERAEQTRPETVAAMQRFLDPRRPIDPADAATIAGAGMLSDVMMGRNQIKVQSLAAQRESMRFLVEQQRAQAAQAQAEASVQRSQLGVQKAGVDLQTAEARRDTAGILRDKAGTARPGGGGSPLVDAGRIREGLTERMRGMVDPKKIKDGKVKDKHSLAFEAAVLAAEQRHEGATAFDPSIMQEELRSRGLLPEVKEGKKKLSIDEMMLELQRLEALSDSLAAEDEDELQEQE